MDPSSSGVTTDDLRFPFLYARHRATVRGALAMLGVERENLEDAVQDVFAVLHRRLADYDRRRSLSNWLWGIARGVASGYRRSARRRSRLHRALAPFGTGSTEPTGRIEAGDALDAMFSSLDPEKCAVLILADVEGRSGPEIADRLGINVNTVYARLRAARRGLRDAAARHEHPRWSAAIFAWGSKLWPMIPACAAVGLTLSMERSVPAAAYPALMDAAAMEDVEDPGLVSARVPLAPPAQRGQEHPELASVDVEILEIQAPRQHRRSPVRPRAEAPAPVAAESISLEAEPPRQPEGLWVTVPMRSQPEALFEVPEDFVGELTALVGE